MNPFNIWLRGLFSHIILISMVGCSSPDESPLSAGQPSEQSKRLSYAEFITELGDIDSMLKQKSADKTISKIKTLEKYVASSFPVYINEPFYLHTFQDAVSKTTSNIEAKASSVLSHQWLDLLNALDGQHFFHDQTKVALDMSVARLRLQGKKPILTTSLLNDFTSFTEYKIRNEISIESFWSDAFLYGTNDALVSKQQGTGVVLVKDDAKIVGLLEFKNNQVSPKLVDINSQNNLMYVVPMTPGYVSSVSRRAAYARLGIGSLMFAEFLAHARLKGITESYLHVRASNDAAINLYQSHGYKEVARITSYYSNPREDALVMLNKLL